MVPELRYVNRNIEACIFGKSLNEVITEKDPHRRRIQEKEFLAHFFQIPPERIFFLEQVHGNDVIRITERDVSENKNVYYQKADGLITELENIILCIRTADCLPLFIHSNPNIEQTFIGIAHVGWRSLQRGIIPNIISMIIFLIKKTIFEYKIQKKEIPYDFFPLIIFPGAYIPEDLYPVGKEVADLFPHIRIRNEIYYLDLWKNSLYAIHNMKEHEKFDLQDPFAYITSNQKEIFENFFSHRRKDVSRNLNIIYIKKKR